MRAIRLIPHQVSEVMTNRIRLILKKNDYVELMNKDYIISPFEPGKKLSYSPGSLYFYQHFEIPDEPTFIELSEFHGMELDEAKEIYGELPYHAYAFRFRPFHEEVSIKEKNGTEFIYDAEYDTDRHVSIELIEDPMMYDPRRIDNTYLMYDWKVVLNWVEHRDEKPDNVRDGIELDKVGHIILREILKRGMELDFTDTTPTMKWFTTKMLKEIEKKNLYEEYFSYDSQDMSIEERGGEWCVVHGHPQKSETDKPIGTVIKCWPTEAEAIKHHKAIVISQQKGKGMDRMVLGFIMEQMDVIEVKNPYVSIVGGLIDDGYSEGDIILHINEPHPVLEVEFQLFQKIPKSLWNRVKFVYGDITEGIGIMEKYEVEDYISYPFKYIGSKRAMMNDIIQNTPLDVNTVVDGFMGSGVVSYYYRKAGLNVVGCDISNISNMVHKAIIINKSVKLGESDIVSLMNSPKVEGNVSNLTSPLDLKCKKYIDGYLKTTELMDDTKAAIAKSAMLSALSNMFFNGIHGPTEGHLHSSVREKMKRYSISMTGVLQAGLQRWLKMYNNFITGDGGDAVFHKGDIMSYVESVKDTKLDGVALYLDPPYVTENLPHSKYTEYDNWEAILFGGTEDDKLGSDWNFKNFLENMEQIVEKAKGMELVMVSYKENKSFTRKTMEDMFNKHFEHVKTIIIPFRYTFKHDAAKELLFLMSNKNLDEMEYRTSNFEMFMVGCECIKCGHKMDIDGHCEDLKCPKCDGQMRRSDRPGIGRESYDTTESPPWGSISKTKENFPNKSQFIIQRGDNYSDWKLPYKTKSGKIHCGGVRAVASAVGGGRTGKAMSLTSEEKSRFNGAKSACDIGKDNELVLLENCDYIDEDHLFTEIIPEKYSDDYLVYPKDKAHFSLNAVFHDDIMHLILKKRYDGRGVGTVMHIGNFNMTEEMKDYDFNILEEGFSSVKKQFFSEHWPLLKEKFQDGSMKFHTELMEEVDVGEWGKEGYSGCGYTIELDAGEVEFLSLTPYFHEYQFHGRVMNGRYVERKMYVKKGDMVEERWFTYMSDDIPFVLSNSAINEGWVTSTFHSGLPEHIEEKIPEKYQYWNQHRKGDSINLRNQLKKDMNNLLVQKLHSDEELPYDTYYTIQEDLENGKWNINVMLNRHIFTFICENNPIIMKANASFSRKRNPQSMAFTSDTLKMLDKGECDVIRVDEDKFVVALGGLIKGNFTFSRQSLSDMWSVERDNYASIHHIRFEDFMEITETKRTKDGYLKLKGILFRPGNFKGKSYNMNVVMNATLNPIHRGNSLPYINFFHNRDELSRIGIMTKIWWDNNQKWICGEAGKQYRGALMFEGIVTDLNAITAIMEKGTYQVSAEVAFQDHQDTVQKMVVTGVAVCHSPAVDSAQITQACYEGGECVAFPVGITPATA